MLGTQVSYVSKCTLQKQLNHVFLNLTKSFSCLHLTTLQGEKVDFFMVNISKTANHTKTIHMDKQHLEIFGRTVPSNNLQNPQKSSVRHLTNPLAAVGWKQDNEWVCWLSKL